MTERNTNRSFPRKFLSKNDCSCDHAKINLKDDPLYNFLKIFSEICNSIEDLDSKSLISYLNVLVYLSKDLLTKFQHNDCFIICIYSIIKYSLWHICKLVRIAGLRCVRYYVINYRHVELLLRMRMDYLLMRSLDLSYDDAMNNQYRGNDDAERIYCIRLIYRLSLIAPKLIPSTLINTLVGICLIDADKNAGMLDLAIRPSLLIMCNLVNINPSVINNSRILDALQVVIYNSDGKTWRLNFRIIEAVLLTQLKLVVHTHWRDSLPIGYFNKTLTPFSILSKVQPTIKGESSYQMNYTDDQSDFENTSISVLCTILQSWAGLLYLCSSNSKPILSITGILAVGCSEIRDRILDLLFQIFNIYCPPHDCSDFNQCIRSFIDQRSAKNNQHWSLDDDFLVAQCYDCLTYISPSRINVLDNFEVVLLGVFVHNNLFEALANAVADEKESTSARAGILLANISYKVSILFPSDHPLSRRSDTTKLLNNPKSQKALLWIEQVHKELEQYQYEITPFMTYIIQQHPNNSVNEDFLFSKRYLQPSNIEEILDSTCIISSSIPVKKNASLSKSAVNNRLSALLDQVSRDCRIFEPLSMDVSKPYYEQWNWDLLLVFARSLTDPKLLINIDKDLLNRVLKILMKFFTPQTNSSNEYSETNIDTLSFASLPLTWKSSSKAAFVITDIISFMVEFYKASEPQDDLNFFLFTIRSYLCGCLKSVLSNDKFVEITQRYDNNALFNDVLFTDYDLTYKCSSYLILALGRLSGSDLGEACLEANGIVELFKILLDFGQTDVYSKLILGSLDYARPSLGRTLLSVASTSTNLQTRRYAVKFLRVLLRAKVPFFANWAISLLLKLIHDSDITVKNTAFNILQEACEDESIINNLSIDSMPILQLGYSGFLLFSRLFSLPFHFEQLTNRNSIDMILDTWHEKKYDIEYCRQLDEQLLQHFTSYDILTSNSDDPDEGRLSNKAKVKAKELILPCHPYSSLAAHKDGLDWLMNRGFLEDCADILAKEHKNIIYDQSFEFPSKDVKFSDSKELQLRANMLAICHIATSIWGLECAINLNIPTLISDITKFHPSLNVRGTGIICLGLIGSNPRGANHLISLGWMALRSDRFDKWPLLLDVYHHLYQNREEVKRQLQAGTQQFAVQRSHSLFNDCNDDYSEKFDIGTTVGYSVFALPISSKEENQRIRKVTYELSEDDNQVKGYAKSVDDYMVRSKTTTISSSSSNIYSDDEKPGKFSKLIHHRRDLSAGAASMFNVQINETDSLISPHDVLGIATMRRIQKKSRTGLFENKISFNRFSMDVAQADSGDQKSFGGNTDIFCNIRKTSLIDQFINKRRKKFSSLITPKSNLNKYRGLVVPINFIDLTINILPVSNDLCSKLPGADYHNEFRASMLSYSDSESLNIPITAPSTADKVSKPYTINSKCSDSSGIRSFDKDNNGVSYPTYGTSGYISLEESSCVLDLALLAVENASEKSSDLNKTQRSSSDQQANSSHDPICLRPRATTTSSCQDQTKSNLFANNWADNALNSISNVIINIRNNNMFIGDNVPKIHELRNGLSYHHSDYCLHVGCSFGDGSLEESVLENIVEFRKEILYAVSGLIALGPKTKKMEMGLAKLKSSQSPQMWSDLCLYSEICILLSLYNYSRQSRLYLQDLFVSVPMIKLIDDMRSCLHEFSHQFTCSQSTRL